MPVAVTNVAPALGPLDGCNVTRVMRSEAMAYRNVEFSLCCLPKGSEGDSTWKSIIPSPNEERGTTHVALPLESQET